MMNKLDLKRGDYIRLESVNIPIGTSVTVRLVDNTLLGVEDVQKM